MFEFTVDIDIRVPIETAWAQLVDLDGWWQQSNPAHEDLRWLDDPPLEEGTRLEVRESVAGIPGVASGVVTEFIPGDRITWEAPHARYRLGPIRLTAHEGVTWAVRQVAPSLTRVSAHVWARFPDTLWGRLTEWSFRYLWRGLKRDRAHARTELRYLERTLERRPRTTLRA